MKRFALFVGLLIVLLTFGCGKQEQAEEKTAPEAAVAETPETATEHVAQVADQVAEKTSEVAAHVEKKTEEAVKTASDAVEQKAEKVTEAVESVAETGKEKAAETVTTVEEKAGEAATAVQEKAAEVVAAVTPEKTSGEGMVIESSYGNVTFNHTKHSETIDCATCHGEGEPGPLTMGKDQAHKVCKGCHMEKAAGPTKCSACHVK